MLVIQKLVRVLQAGARAELIEIADFNLCPLEEASRRRAALGDNRLDLNEH